LWRSDHSIIGDAISLKTKAQLRAARALLEWSQAVLAERSGISLPTIKRLEPGDEPMAAAHSTVVALERALEAAGVEFTDGERPGVRLARCPTCFGTGNNPVMRTPKRGAKLVTQPCPDCDGTGRAKPLSIPIDKLNASNDE
jgi:DNA-binding XRE family transcriptional regulator